MPEWGADCLASSIKYLPANTPAIWPYITGTTSAPDVEWPASAILSFQRSGAHITRVNQGFQQNAQDDAFHGDEFDVESGAWSVSDAITIIGLRRTKKWSTRIYCSWDDYQPIKQSCARAGTAGSLYFRIADWSMSEPRAAQLWGDIYAVQWASPSSNPNTLIPGTQTTLRAAGADLNVLISTATGWRG